jgi:hypothetical protein
MTVLVTDMIRFPGRIRAKGVSGFDLAGSAEQSLAPRKRQREPESEEEEAAETEPDEEENVLSSSILVQGAQKRQRLDD